MLDVIAELLSEKLGKDIEVMRQFPPKTKVHPLSKITLAIGAKKRRLIPKCIGNNLTENFSGKEMLTEIEIGAYVPLTMNSSLVYEVIDDVSKILSADERFGITGYEHGVLSANRATGSFELHTLLTSTLYETEE